MGSGRGNNNGSGNICSSNVSKGNNIKGNIETM
jgi:hypothetical protein